MSMNLKINRYDTKKEKRRKVSDVIYVVITMTLFAAVGAAMLIFPRSTESELEKRELAKFPKFSLETFVSGEFTNSLNTYFSDTVPYRDDLMVVSSMIRNMTGFRMNDIKLHNVTIAEATQTEPSVTEEIANFVTDAPMEEVEQFSFNAQTTVTESDGMVQEPFSEITTAENGEDGDGIDMDDTVSITNNGIAVVGTRALMLYGGSYTVGENYAKVISEYKKQLGNSVNVYCMVIPTSVEFYCPDSIKEFTSEQLGNINNIYSNLQNGVKPVDAYTTLSLHTSEPIYFRTDHHWSSLGAYYAAKQFAETAEVPFADLSAYDEKVVEGYVGTMYGYTQDIVIKNNPEDFVYYVPKDVEYTTTYYNYILGENNRITGMQEPYDANFFVDFSKNKSMLYGTFMGGDAKITHVKTSTRNGRKLAIFKDSYGNALPQFLFGSFEEIYVFDMRFFTYNAVDYIKQHGITDLLFANNAFHATTKSTVTYYNSFLTQGRAAETTTTATTTAPVVVQGIPPRSDTTPPIPAVTAAPVTVPPQTTVTTTVPTAAPVTTTSKPRTETSPTSKTTAKSTASTSPTSKTTAGQTTAKPETTSKKPAETTTPASAEEEIIS
ncbi:MAG: DHHW family protein [Ruminococcus sp.]|nr:DHHW family protein [Ruminococcus sp.]MCM1381629.1 DHHW family protein [Muribaculaceae bacterium]MCM1479252.1 DHHW family protein [Muribaculaceae bacterium]